MTQTISDCTLSGKPPYNCEGCDLSGKNLAGKDLSKANLKNTTLIGTIFKGVTSMDGANLTGATMGNGTDFSGCDLSKTIFGPKPNFGSNPSNPTKFIGATIPYQTLGTTWSYVDLTNATITGLPLDLSQLTVMQANLTGIDLSGKMLKNAHFSHVTLQGAHFCNGALDTIVFIERCDLTGAKFCNARIPSGVFDTSTLKDTDFTGATLDQASFLQTSLVGTRFDNTDVTTCSFSQPPRFSRDPSNLTSFRGARLNYSTIQKQWSYLELSGATLVGLSSSVDLTYLQAQYAVLAGMDLSNYTLNQCNLSGATLTGVKFSNAKMSYALLPGVQNTCELFRVPQTSADDYQSFLNALANNSASGVSAIFTKYGHSISATQTTVNTDNPKRWWTITDASTHTKYPVANWTSATNTKATYLSVMSLNLVTRFDGATLLHANFGPNNGQPTVLHGAIFNGATTLDHADFSLADLGQVNPNNATTASQFKSASMNNVGLSQANLTGAQLTGGVFLHNANLICCTLKGADLTGAQLGALSELFRVSHQTSADDYKNFLTALRGDNVSGVSAIFAKYQHPISAAQTSIKTTVPDRSWSITDSSSQTTYTVLNWTSSDNSTFLIVSTPTQAAKLTGAYMPGATLTNANLYMVQAPYIQLYGANVHLDGAILDFANFANANLGSSNVIVKTLYNVVLTGAILVNAHLKGADLSQNVSLAKANVQGADFTNTRLNGVDFSNAAVSVSLGSTLSGVYLFSVRSTDSNYQAVLAELQAALNQINLIEGKDRLPYIDDLNKRDLSRLLPLFQQNNVNFSKQATIAQTDTAGAWQIRDASPPGNYTVWDGYDDLGDEALLARPSLPTLRQVFHDNASVSGDLRWQASVTAGPAAKQWIIDNDSENPKNLQLGYATLLVVQESDGALAFYGTQLKIQQLGDNNQLEIRFITFNPTILCTTDTGGNQQCNDDGSGSFFGPSTVCPNTRTLSQNQNSSPPVPWRHMLRALPPPKPPVCVPSPYADCPQSSLFDLVSALQESGSGLGEEPGR